MQQVLNEYGFRTDGRKPDELRKISLKLGIVEDSDGSAYYEQGNVRVIASVFGPSEVTKGGAMGAATKLLINCSVSQAAFSVTEQRQVGPDRRTFDLSHALNQVLGVVVLSELYKGNQLNLNVQILETDGPVISAAINATMLALCDAGIAMKGLVTACSACVLHTSQPGQKSGDDGKSMDITVCDITSNEEMIMRSVIDMAVLYPHKEIVHLQLDCKVHATELPQVLDTLTCACDEIRKTIEMPIKQYAAVGCTLNVDKDN